MAAGYYCFLKVIMLQDHACMVQRINASVKCLSSPSPIVELPTDILNNIVSFLSTSAKEAFALACKKFRAVVDIKALRSLFDLASLLERKDLPIISSFYPAANVLILKQRYWLNSLFRGLYQGATTLSFSTCDLSVEQFEEVFRYCQNAVSLDLSLTSVDDKILTRAILPTLSSLSVAHCSHLNLTKEVLHSFPNLTKLSVSYCPNINFETFVDILANCRGLQYVEAIGCDLGGEPSQVRLPLQCDLKFINLSQTQLSDGPFKWLIESCQQLRSLNISRCARLDATSIRHALSNIQFLEEFYCTHGTQACMYFDYLRTSKTILKVDASYSDINAQTVIGLLAVPQLMWLNVSSCLVARKDSLRRESKLLSTMLAGRERLSVGTLKYFQINPR